MNDAAISTIRQQIDEAEKQADELLAEGESRAASIRRRADEESRAILQQAERRAREVLQTASASADAVEISARMRANRVLADTEMRVWSSLNSGVLPAAPKPRLKPKAKQAQRKIAARPAAADAPKKIAEPTPMRKARTVAAEPAAARRTAKAVVAAVAPVDVTMDFSSQPIVEPVTIPQAIAATLPAEPIAAETIAAPVTVAAPVAAPVVAAAPIEAASPVVVAPAPQPVAAVAPAQSIVEAAPQAVPVTAAPRPRAEAAPAPRPVVAPEPVVQAAPAPQPMAQPAPVAQPVRRQPAAQPDPSTVISAAQFLRDAQIRQAEAEIAARTPAVVPAGDLIRVGVSRGPVAAYVRASTPPAPRFEPIVPEREPLGLRVLEEDQDGYLRYAIDGELSFADVLALRQEVTEIPGVDDLDITLESNVAMTLSLRAIDPEGTLFALQRLERLPLVLKEAEEVIEPEAEVQPEPAKRRGLGAALKAFGRTAVKSA